LGYNAIQPLYPFGFGLSYTQFSYSDLVLSRDKITYNDSISVSVKITNIGNREGKEVVQLYVRDEFASITPSVKRLKGFAKVALQAGESRLMTFVLHPKDLGFVNAKNEWITEVGDFTVLVAQMNKGFTLSK
jgi:beta-glucosidase